MRSAAHCAASDSDAVAAASPYTKSTCLCYILFCLRTIIILNTLTAEHIISQLLTWTHHASTVGLVSEMSIHPLTQYNGQPVRVAAFPTHSLACLHVWLSNDWMSSHLTYKVVNSLRLVTFIGSYAVNHANKKQMSTYSKSSLHCLMRESSVLLNRPYKRPRRCRSYVQ